jgi:hypothetical protein
MEGFTGTSSFDDLSRDLGIENQYNSGKTSDDITHLLRDLEQKYPDYVSRLYECLKRLCPNFLVAINKLFEGSHDSNARSNCDEFLHELKDLSSILLNWNKYFSNTNKLHIPRDATWILRDWINTPLQSDESNVRILVDHAGYGKTVILTSLLEKLFDDNIPALGIKADFYADTSIEELTNSMGISGSIIE